MQVGEGLGVREPNRWSELASMVPGCDARIEAPLHRGTIGNCHVNRASFDPRALGMFRSIDIDLGCDTTNGDNRFLKFAVSCLFTSFSLGYFWARLRQTPPKESPPFDGDLDGGRGGT